MQGKKKKGKRSVEVIREESEDHVDYFEPRLPCNRTFTGGWVKTNAIPLRNLVSEPANPTMLAGSTFRRTLSNYSDKTVYVFDRTGELVDTLPPTFSDRPNIDRRVPEVRVKEARRTRPSFEGPFANEEIFTNQHGGVQKDPNPFLENSGSEHRGTMRYVKTPQDPNMGALSGQQVACYVENALLIELTRLTPLSLSDDKGKRKGTVRDVISDTDRSQDVEQWNSQICVHDIANKAPMYNGCDAVYHPGVGLYFSTNKESEYVGKVDEALFAILTSSNIRLNTDGFCPVVVFAPSNTIEDVFYYSNNGKDIFAAPVIRSGFMPEGTFRLRTTSYVGDGDEPQRVAGTLEFSLEDLEENKHHIVMKDSDIILGRSVGEVKTFLENHPRYGLFVTGEDGQPLGEDVQAMAAEMESLKEQLDKSRHENRKSKREIEALSTNIGNVLAQFKNGEFKTADDLIKALSRAQTQIKMPVEENNLFARMSNVEKATKNIAGVSKNIKEIILFSSAIAGAAGTLGASAMALRERWKSRSGEPRIVLKDGDL